MTETPPGAVRVVGAAWIRDGRVLGARRAPGTRNAGTWELPGGKVEPGEQDHEALVRELREELGIHAQVGPLVRAHVHPYPHALVHLLVYTCTSQDEPTLRDHDRVEWFAADTLESVVWSEADRPAIEAIRAWIQ